MHFAAKIHDKDGATVSFHDLIKMNLQKAVEAAGIEPEPAG